MVTSSQRQEGEKMRRIIGIAVALAACAFPAVAAAAPAVAATSHPAACSTSWGTNAKHHGSGATAPTPVTGVRAGRASCFDRLTVELGGGPKPSWSVQYVKHILAQGSGQTLAVKGRAKLLVVVDGPAGHRFHPNAVNLANVTGFRTFRQVRGAGSFERVTALGLGVRAKLAFRAFLIGSSTAGWGLIIDVAH
jgi:hypothetical protein